MSTVAHYVPEGRDIDLSNVSDEDYRLVESLIGHCSEKDPILLCPRPGGGSMYVQRRYGNLWAIHHQEHGHGSTRVSRMSDEHRRANDYFVRAGEDAGYGTAVEVRTDRRTRLDSVIFGPRMTGIEVQHSALSKRAAINRTAKSLNARSLAVGGGEKSVSGVLPVWFDTDDKEPRWFHHVPSVGCNKIPWDALPERRSLTATGLRQVRAVRCVPGAFERCPKTKRNACGEWHPKVEPARGLTVDDVAAMVPDGQLVPLHYYGRWVYLVDPRSLATYEDITGAPHEFRFHEKAHPDRPREQESTECPNPRHDLEPFPRAESWHQMPLPEAGPSKPSCSVTELAPRTNRRARHLALCPGVMSQCGARLRDGSTYCQACRLIAKLHGLQLTKAEGSAA